MTHTIELTTEQLRDLIDALDDLADEMDDDGNEGAFDNSPLKVIYDMLTTALEGR